MTIKVKNLNHLDVWVRTVKTAVAVFLATWALSGNAITKDSLVTAGAAAVTAAWNYLLQVVRG